MVSYYGKYRAKVVNVDDTAKINRVTLRVPAVFGDDESDWAFPCDRFSWVPVAGDKVWCEFEGGDPNKPLYSGRWVAAPGGSSELPSDVTGGYPNVRLIDSPDGAKIMMDASTNEIKLVHSGGTAKITFDADGNITIETDQKIVLKTSLPPGVADPIISLGDGATELPIMLAGDPNFLCQFTGAPHTCLKGAITALMGIPTP